jgi:hypothetical protein
MIQDLSHGRAVGLMNDLVSVISLDIQYIAGSIIKTCRSVGVDHSRLYRS